METVFLCEDSIGGIFTGVYDAWASKKGHDNLKLELQECNTFRLFAEYTNVTPDVQKVQKVSHTIREKLGDEAYYRIMQAALAKDDHKADAIYRTIVVGIALGNRGKVMDCLSYPDVLKVFELSRTVYYEAEHMKGFLRFKELKNGLLLATIAPKSNLLTIISPHFADRLVNENWMIYDEKRSLFAAHPKQKKWILVEGEQINLSEIDRFSEYEDQIQSLWRCFFNSVSIKDRENYQLQRQNLPIRFRKNVLEFTKD